jgi:hypothetical protein
MALAAGACGLLSAAGVNIGCQQKPAEHPPQIAAPRYAEAGPRREEKPLPDPTRDELPPPPFIDAPLISQRPPEQREFLRAYEGVGRPRFAVFVNRTLQGQGEPVPNPRPGGDTRRQYGRQLDYDSWDRSGDLRGDDYLAPGEYDEAFASKIDYATIETVLTQWINSDGQVTVMSPSVIRSRLKPEEVTRLEQGRLRELRELAKELDTDILVQVQVRPTRQSTHGPIALRLNAESINMLGGESIGRATVLIPPPLSSEQINKFTRFVARKLMSDMIQTWSSPGPGARPRDGATQPGTDGRPVVPTPPRNDVPPGTPDAPAAPAPAPEPPPAGDPPPVPPPPPPGAPGQERPSILDNPPRSGGGQSGQSGVPIIPE